MNSVITVIAVLAACSLSKQETPGGVCQDGELCNEANGKTS